MSHLPTCRPCDEAPVCNNPNTRYSLQDEIFFFVGGGAGSGRNELFLACCDGVLMRQDFPLGISANARAALIQDLLGRCARREPFCVNPPPPCPVPPCDVTPPLTNNPQTCTANCPGGSVFSFTVPAGTFVGTDQELLDQLAHELACQQAQNFIICLADWNGCACVGQLLTQRIPITSNHPPFSASVSAGALPPGLRVVTQGNFLIITGTPVVNGTYGFTVQVVDGFGNKASKSYAIVALEITTDSLPEYSIGVPYSFQLEADGGSGNYAWRVASGTLPTGLTLSTGGLISGTPTVSVTANLVFEVIDQTCEAVTRSFIQPRISMVTSATTVLRVKRGYPEYVTSSGTLYKRVSWSGQIVQEGFVAAWTGDPGLIGSQCGGARYEYSGATEIDIYGRVIQNHSKDLYVECLRNIYPQIGGDIAELTGARQISRFFGYCWVFDQFSCPACPTDPVNWLLKGDFQTPNPVDPPTQMLLNPAGFSLTPTTRDYSGTLTENFSITDADGLSSVNITATGEFGSVLSDPYTDQDAEDSKTTFRSNLAVADNGPNYLRVAGQNFLTLIYSRNTEVGFTLNCTNLIVGQEYLVRYQLVDSDGTITNVQETFEADSINHQITGTVPTPEAGHAIRVRNPTIGFI